MADKNKTRLQNQIARRPDVPAGLLDLGHALVGPPEPVQEKACDAFQNMLPDYVEAELNSQPVRRLFPALARHLDHCSDCGSTYIALLEIALQAEEEPLPVPASLPAPDLSFLPPLTVAERTRQLCGALAEGLVRAWHSELLADLPHALHTLFRQLDQMGGVALQQRPASALAFGPGAPPALQAAVMVYTATDQALRALSPADLEAELRGDRPPRTLEKQARAAARRVGLGRKEADRLAVQYARLAREHAAEILGIAQARAEAGFEET